MTLLISETRTDGEFVEAVASTVAIQVDESLKAEVVKLNAMVKEANALSMETFWFGTVWTKADADDLEAMKDDGQSEEDIVNYAEKQSESVELQILIVRDSGFCFSAVPKHGSATETMYSKLFPMDALSS